jgi:hypothetical protein
MNLEQYHASFDEYMGVKSEPNAHEIILYERAEKYIKKISWIPGIRMIAVVNSLSMFATHGDSDIDLFFVTTKNRMWLSRVLITLIFWVHWVWRHHEDIAGNFCLSFWVEESALSLSKIAIENDVYLSFWAYYMKPILADDTIWEEFTRSNKEFQFAEAHDRFLKFWKRWQNTSNFFWNFLTMINHFLRFFLEKWSKRTFLKKGSPDGVIIAPDMLKFHDQDRRIEIREALLATSRIS